MRCAGQCDSRLTADLEFAPAIWRAAIPTAAASGRSPHERAGQERLLDEIAGIQGDIAGNAPARPVVSKYRNDGLRPLTPRRRARAAYILETALYLMRIGESGAERPAARIDGVIYVDLSDVVDDFDEAFFGGGGLDRIRPIVADRVAGGQVSRLAGERVGAPIARPHQILGIGLNYRDHAAETGQAVPDEPILFNKSPNSLIGPYDDVRIPRGSTKLDWEVELGIVIGQRCSYLDSLDEAREAVAGYLVANDVSERGFQIERGGQWVKGKSAETFNPAGPWLVTPDEIDDILALDMWLDVNEVRRQTGNTQNMVFDPYFLVYYLSQFLVLEPGDLINTGTPPGVGMGFKPPVWLQPGDVMELGIEGLGSQRQNVLGPR
jgi:2,4-didehydro-3-deoxy-L-rhamnonate hydrolase